MATEAPAWLDVPYVQRVLQNAENDQSIEVRDIVVKAATAKGDNYGSNMYRVTVEFSRVQDGHQIQEKRSLIAKVSPEGDRRQEMLETSEVFETEFLMISVTLPKMDELLEGFCSSTLGPRHLYIQYEKPTHAVIEDLIPKGFRMADRHAGLDLDHSLLAIQNLARFHAASIALKEKDPKALMRYKMGMLHKDQPEMLRAFFNSGAKALAQEAAKWPEINSRISEKLHKLSEALYDKGCEAALFREDDFNVLNHGDFWLNNMLFRYDEQQKPIDHIFVDFQISYYGSPAFDLLYFLGTSPTDDVRLHHRELLLREYHATLSSTMAKLKCETEVLSLEKLLEKLKERAFCEVVATITILPFVVLEKGDEIIFDELMLADGGYNNVGYRGKRYRAIMSRLLPLYDTLGLLDV